jgi:hypothetical protein
MRGNFISMQQYLSAMTFLSTRKTRPKDLLYIIPFFLTLSSQALEKLETPSVGIELPDKILPVILPMNASQISEFSSYLQHAFYTLEKQDVIKRPFTPTQARIINYHFRKSWENIPAMAWDYTFSFGDKTFSLSFCDIVSMYADLQTLFKPAIQHPTGAKAESPPKAEDIAHYLRSFLPYVNAYRLHYNVPAILANDLLGIAKNTNRVLKISVYFRRFQRSWSTIETTTPWNWIEMRYHLGRVNYYMDNGLFALPQPLSFAPLDDFSNLFLGYISDKENFLKTLKEVVKILQTKIAFPPEEDPVLPPSRDKHRKKLKILFNQLELLNLAEFQKNGDIKYLRVLEFWNLYLKLTKNHLIKSSLPSPTPQKYDSKKITHLCNTLLHGTFEELEDEKVLATPVGTYDEKDIEKVLAMPEGLECVETILTSFPNPFAPHLHEILAYTYHTTHLTDMLDDMVFSAPTTPLSPLSYIPGLNTIASFFSFSKEK